MDLDRQDEGHSKRKKKIPKHQRREANAKEMDSFTRRVLKIPLDVPYDEAYYTHRLWMFFRESRETDDDIESMFNHLREKMRQRVCLKKKSDPGKFVIPCFIKGNEYPNALCDTGSAVSIMPRTMAKELNLMVEHSNDSFTFVDCSKAYSGGMVKDVPVQINNTLVPVDFHVMDIMIDWNSSLLLGRAFMATVGAICDMHSNRLYLSLIDQHIFYEPVKNKNKATLIELGNDAELVATCYCDYEHDEESDERASIDTQPITAIDRRATQQSIDTHPYTSIDTPYPDPIYNYQANFGYNTEHLDEYDESYREKEMIEYQRTRRELAGIFHISHRIGKSTSIDGNHTPSIDTELKEESELDEAAWR